jgi:hypothetical protein
MDIAALVLWILTAGGGSVLLGTWLTKGGTRTEGAGSRFPVPVIFGHFALAAIGLVLWIAYVATDTTGIGWAAFVLLLVVALLGFTMFARWVPTYLSMRRGPDADPSVYAASATGSVTTVPTTATAARTAESHFPVPIVLGHGALAATTLVLVLIALLTG